MSMKPTNLEALLFWVSVHIFDEFAANSWIAGSANLHEIGDIGVVSLSGDLVLVVGHCL